VGSGPGLAVWASGDELALLATRDGGWIHSIGRRDGRGQPAVVDAVLLRPPWGASGRVTFHEDGRTKELVADGHGGARLDWTPQEGTVRVRVWSQDGTLGADEVVEAPVGSLRLPSRAPVGEVGGLGAPGPSLTVRVPVVDCDGFPQRYLVENARSATVVAHGTSREADRPPWTIRRLAHKDGDEFIADFPLEPTLLDLADADCRYVLEVLYGRLTRCEASAWLLEFLGLRFPPLKPLLEIIEGLVEWSCLEAEMAAEFGCTLALPELPYDVEEQLHVTAVEAEVELGTCEGVLPVRSSLVPIDAFTHEVEVEVDGCAGENPPAPVLAGVTLLDGEAGIVRLPDRFEIYEPDGMGGTATRVVLGIEAALHLTDRVLETDTIHASEGGELSRIELHGSARSTATMDEYGGWVESSATLGRREIMYRTPTPEERPEYESDREYLLREIEEDVIDVTAAVLATVMPMQEVVLRVTHAGAGDARVDLISLTGREVAQTHVSNSTQWIRRSYDQVAGTLGVWGVTVFPCLPVILVVQSTASAELSGTGSRSVTMSIDYLLEVEGE
jgi:hypothetical protein